MATVTEAQRSFYDEVGGAETFQLLVSRFYQLVRDDEVLVVAHAGEASSEP